MNPRGKNAPQLPKHLAKNGNVGAEFEGREVVVESVGVQMWCKTENVTSQVQSSNVMAIANQA